MMNRISRSWRLMKQSFGVLMKDKELMLLPVISSVLILAVLASFIIPMGLFGGSFGGNEGAGGMDENNSVLAVGAFVFYVISYTIGIFFQGAVIAGASQRLAGGDPTVGSSIRAAAKRWPAFLMWGLIGATVGMVIRAVLERSELLGRIVMGLVGMVWSLAIFFIVPVLVMEREGVGGSLKRSWSLFKQTWGESVAGSVGFGFLGFLLALPIVGVAMGLFSLGFPIVGMLVAVLGIAFLGLFLSTLQGVYLASLYRYATVGEVPEGFDEDLFKQAFRRK
jgi:uncharacterized protein DUF6159